MPESLIQPPVDRAQILHAAATLGVLAGGASSGPRMLAALCDPAISTVAVAALIEKEPTMVARVLRVANSSYYGQSRGIRTLERALQLLGLDAVRGIAAATCLDRGLVREPQAALIAPRTLTLHSLATAAAAEALARLRHPELAPEAFIASLVHNLGIPVQVQLDRAGVSAMLAARAAHDARDLVALEAQFTRVSHAECMAVVYESWQLPESLVAATRYHHRPLAAPAPHQVLAAFVYLGGALALAGGYTFSLEPAAVPAAPEVLQLLALEKPDLEAVSEALPGRVAALIEALLT
jgi:HD-like signal output (HDOD) protein